MAEGPPSEFKFDDDDQDPETFYHEEIRDLRIEKLSQRITLISILLPCLMAVAIYFGYRNLTGRMSQSQDTGFLEVQKLSGKIDDLSKKFNEKLITFTTTLSTQDKDFGTSTSERLTTIKKNIDALNKNLKALNENLTQTKSTIKKLDASKADKKSQEAAITKINAALEPLKKELQALTDIRRDLKSLSSEIVNLEGELTKKLAELAALTEQFGKDYDRLQASITNLSDEKIDKDSVYIEVFKLKKNFQSLISQEIAGLNRRLDSIQKKMDDMERISRSSKKSMKSLSKKITPRNSTAKKTGSVKETTPAKSATIDEQDLLE